MSSLYTIVLANKKFVSEAQDWLAEQKVVFSGDFIPSRWPTLGEMLDAVKELPESKYHNYFGGALNIETSNGKCFQTMYLMTPYPNSPGDKFEFYLSGYCETIMPPLLSVLSKICGKMIVIENGSGEVVFYTP